MAASRANNALLLPALLVAAFTPALGHASGRSHADGRGHAPRLGPLQDIVQGLGAWVRLPARQLIDRRPYWVRRGIKPPPDGRAQPVLVIPGLMVSDPMMKPFAKEIARAGYKTFNGKIRLNVGSIKNRVNSLIRVVEEKAEKSGQRVIIIGHSLGGPLGETVASLRPDLVKAVVGISSAIGRSGTRRSRKDCIYRKGCINKVLMAVSRAVLRDGAIILRQPPPSVPVYSIRGLQDGLMEPRGAIVPGGDSRNFTVPGGHTGAPFISASLDTLLYRVLPEAAAN